MKALYPMADIMTLLTKLEGNVQKLSVIYATEEAVNPIDVGLIDSFIAKAQQLQVAAEALKTIPFNP